MDLAGKNEVTTDDATKQHHRHPQDAQEAEVETTPDLLYSLTLAQAQLAFSLVLQGLTVMSPT